MTVSSKRLHFFVMNDDWSQKQSFRWNETPVFVTGGVTFLLSSDTEPPLRFVEMLRVQDEILSI